MRFLNEVALAAASNTGTVTSAAIDASNLFAASAQAKFTDGTAAGTLVLQGSNDLPTPGGPTNWSDIPNTSQSVSSGALTLVPRTEICYRYIRVSWTSSGGAGTLTATLQAQGF